MKFNLYNDVLLKSGQPGLTWIEAGEYNVVRLFDDRRVIIDLGETINGNRQITVVPINKGKLSVS